MKKINTDLLLSLLVIVLFFFTFNAYAQEDDGTINIPDAQRTTVETVNRANEVEDPYEYNSARAQAVTATTAVSNAIIFIAPEITSGGEDIQNSNGVTNDMKRGLYGMATDGVVAMYETQPYVDVYAHLASEWVPSYDDATSVYAIETGPYDSGYTELINSGIEPLWTQIRNITYIFFMIIFIVVGFMIMFRSKIGGQTLITLGNSLPNIILALIGVTFSFAIAGLIIDIGGVIMVILVDIFEGASSYNEFVTLESIGSLFKAFLPGNFWQNITTRGVEGGKSGLLGIFGGASLMATIFGGKSAVTAIAAGSLASVPNFLAILGGVGIVGLVIILVILGIVTVGVFKVFISLIKAYLGILLNVIMGPISIALSAIPGNGKSFINWVKNIFRNVLVYPITFAILNVPGVIYSLDEGGLSLPGPDKLTLPQNANQIDQSQDLVSGVVVFIVQILVIFAASNADKYAQAIIPPTTTREGAAATEAAKKGMQGIPFIGKLIK